MNFSYFFRIWAIFCAFYVLSATDLNDLATEVHGKITKVSRNKIFFKISEPDPKIPIKPGEIGAVIKNFGEKSSIIKTIVAQKTGAVMIENDFFSLAQKNLPTPTVLPSKGDDVAFRSQNSVAFLVAPNEKAFDAAKNHLKNFEILSPDLLYVNAIENDSYDPRAACRAYSAGIFFIILAHKISALDCRTLVFIAEENFTTPDPENATLPFFSRARNIYKKDVSMPNRFKAFRSEENYQKFYEKFVDASKNYQK